MRVLHEVFGCSNDTAMLKIFTRSCIYIYIYIYTYIYTHTHTYIHACTHTFTKQGSRAYIHTTRAVISGSNSEMLTISEDSKLSTDEAENLTPRRLWGAANLPATSTLNHVSLSPSFLCLDLSLSLRLRALIGWLHLAMLACFALHNLVAMWHTNTHFTLACIELAQAMALHGEQITSRSATFHAVG
jgi:hypothetical protein